MRLVNQSHKGEHYFLDQSLISRRRTSRKIYSPYQGSPVGVLVYIVKHIYPQTDPLLCFLLLPSLFCCLLPRGDFQSRSRGKSAGRL